MVTGSFESVQGKFETREKNTKIIVFSGKTGLMFSVIDDQRHEERLAMLRKWKQVGMHLMALLFVQKLILGSKMYDKVMNIWFNLYNNQEV